MAPGDQVGAATVRFADQHGNTVGCGFLLARDRVGTCAHVVADAVGVSRAQREAPTGEVSVTFPVVRDAPPVRAEVIDWLPLSADGSGDVAILRLLDPAPAPPLPVRITSDVRGHGFRVLGFPQDEPHGVRATGELVGPAGTGPVQLRSDQRWSIPPSFRGSPVWSAEVDAVVGMVGTGGNLIPMAELGEAWSAEPANPYPAAFDESDAHLFRGRADEVASLDERLRRRDLLAVAGPPGSGKSSLVRAGLLPGLRAAGAHVVEIRPAVDSPPREVLADALGRDVLGQGGADLPDTVLFLDQFEEVVIADPGVAREWIELLIGVLGARRHGPRTSQPLRVVLTLCSRSLDELMTAETSRWLNQAVHLIGPMSRRQLREAITEPAAEVGGLAFEAGLVERILDDTDGDPGNVPLVALVLRRLWEQRGGGWLTHAAYQRIGGVPGAVGSEAESVYGSLPAARQEQARRLLTQLAEPDGEGGYARRSVRLGELTAESRMAARELARLRLVTVAGSSDGQRVDLAHQALIDRWRRLREWVDEDREFHAWQDDLRRDLRRWEQDGRAGERLPRGVPLARAEGWLNGSGHEIGAEQRDFIERGQAAERARSRGWAAMAAIAVTLALVATVLAVVVADREARIGDRLRAANVDLIARESNDAAEARPLLALQMALSAWHEKPYDPEAYGALLRQRLYWRGADRLHSELGEFSGGTWQSSVDGRVVLAEPEGSPGVVSVLRGLTTSRPSRQDLAVDPGNAVRLSPDGRQLAEFGGSTITVRALEGGQPRILHTGVAMEQVAFGARSRFLAAIPAPGESGAVQVWDAATGQRIPSAVSADPASDGVRVVRAYPTPDGRSLVSQEWDEESGQNRVVVREIATGAEERASAGGEVIASGTATVHCEWGIVTIRDARTGSVRGERSGADCGSLSHDLSQRYVLFAKAAHEDFDSAVHVPSGRGFSFSEPVRGVETGSLLVPRSARTLTALTNVDGVLRSGRVHTSDRRPVDVRPSQVEAAPDHEGWVVDTGSGLALLNSRGRVAKSVRVPEPPQALSFDGTGDHVITVSGGTIRFYSGRNLALESEKVLPAAPAFDADGAAPSILPLSETETLVVYAGRVTYWNPAAGEQTSRPLWLGDEDSGAAVLRPGWDQLLVRVADRYVLWDFEERKRVATFGVAPAGDQDPVIDSTGSVAAVVGRDRVVALDLNRRAEFPVLGTGGTTLHGISDRYLFVESGSDFQVWDWQAREPVAGLPLGDGNVDARSVLPMELVLDSRPGQREAFALNPEVWFRDLCALSDRAFTREESRLLPAGASRERPCTTVW